VKVDPRLRVAVLWLAFTAVTTRWMEWGEPIRRNYATDELQYQSFARAAPGLPHAPVSAAAAQRFGAHWVVGLLSDASGMGIHTTYRIVSYTCLAAIAVVVVRLTYAFALPDWAAAIALGLVLTNPYTCRLLLIAPAMLSDDLLVLGVAIALLGLASERPWLAVAGSLVAVLGREGGLAAAVGVCAWLAARKLVGPAVAALLLPAAVFAVVKTIGAQASLPNPSVHGFTVLSPLLHLPGTTRELADHVARVALASPVSLAVLSVSIGVLAWKGSLRPAMSPLGAALLLASLVVMQPVLFNPSWVQHNESRLAALGIVPLALAAAAACARTGLCPSRAATAAIVGGIAVSSLQHRYTWGGLYESPPAFVAIELVVAAVIAGYIVGAARGKRLPVAPPVPTR
jgi:hypothetical protein